MISKYSKRVFKWFHSKWNEFTLLITSSNKWRHHHFPLRGSSLVMKRTPTDMGVLRLTGPTSVREIINVLMGITGHCLRPNLLLGTDSITTRGALTICVLMGPSALAWWLTNVASYHVAYPAFVTIVWPDHHAQITRTSNFRYQQRGEERRR